MKSVAKRRLSVGLIVAAIAGASVIGTASTASAQPTGDSTATCTWVGGREKIKVTVDGDPGLYTLVTVTNPPVVLGQVEVGADGTGTEVLPFAPAGGYGVTAIENALGARGIAEGCREPIQVGASNVQLDLLDNLLSAVGSSELVTDPTGR